MALEERFLGKPRAVADFARYARSRGLARAEDLPADAPTVYFAETLLSGAIGGASEMTLLAERYGARTDLVAAAHSMRLVLVVIAIPFGMQWAQHQWGLTVDASLLPGPRLAQWPGLLWLGCVTAAGGWVMLKLGRTNPWFMGALLASMALTLTGFQGSAIPTGLSNAAQLVIGVSLGVRFQREFVHTAPRWLASAAAGTLAMMASGATRCSPASSPR